MWLVVHPFATAAVEYIGDADWTNTARFAGEAGAEGFRSVTPRPSTLDRLKVGTELFSGDRRGLTKAPGRGLLPPGGVNLTRPD
jgi:hypothetical protein